MTKRNQNKEGDKKNVDTIDLMKQILSPKPSETAVSVVIKNIQKEIGKIKAKVKDTTQKPDCFADNDDQESIEARIETDSLQNSIPADTNSITNLKPDTIRPDSIRVADLSDIKNLVNKSVGQTRGIKPLRVPNVNYGRVPDIEPVPKKSGSRKSRKSKI